MKKLKVTYDCDDVLWTLNEEVSHTVGVDLKLADRYILSESQIPEEKRNEYLRLFGEPEIFKRLQWYTGIEYVVGLCDNTSVDFMINSGCVNESVLKVKYQRLLEIGFKDEHIYLQNMQGATDAEHKKKMTHSHIWVEDCLANLANADADIKILINKTWNQESKYPEYKYLFPDIIRVNNLVDANKIVEGCIRVWRQAQLT